MLTPSVDGLTPAQQLAAINARTHGEQLGAFVATQLEQRSSRGAA